jgi:hypothetical protein
MKRTLLAILFVSAAALASAETTSLAGKWRFHSSIQGYEGDLDCTLAQEGATVSGTCKSPESEGTLAMTGKVEDKQVTLQYKTVYNGDDLTIVYTAKLESTEKFAGKVDVQPMGVDGEFTATPIK